jgi:DNA-binding transcriptional regulator/RsmH inhibitor MraZ
MKRTRSKKSRVTVPLRVRGNLGHKIKDLISLIREVIGSLAKNTMTKSCKRFRSRIEAVIAADDNFI